MNQEGFDFNNTPVSPSRPVYDYLLADMNVSPYVTVVTPFYNTGEIFLETAQSVLQQSFQQWEWLIVNDGSTDPKSLSILEKYRYNDPRVKVIDHEKNIGVSAARNTGFKNARASYIVQLDSDNLLEPTAIEKWLWFLFSFPEYGFVKGYSIGFGAQEYLWQKGFHNGKEFLNENLVDPTCMIRKEAYIAAGGYDETIKFGLEDWDFWLRCANAGYWGGTVPEYLDWYRRRTNHRERWSNWDGGERQRAFHQRLRQSYPKLWDGGFPEIHKKWHMPYEKVPNVIPCENLLKKSKPRILMIVPWLTIGGADKFNLDLLEQLIFRGWEVTIVATLENDHPWYNEFLKYTCDIFILHRFLRLTDYPRFLRYLIQSRQPDIVMISNSELGYLLLPYLRAYCPEPAYVDYCHMEEEYWKNGGYPRFAVEYQEILDLNIVASEHLKQWMVDQGADKNYIEVCHINVDPNLWKPSYETRIKVRDGLGISDDLPVILYAGRICPQKQPRVFANVMHELMNLNLDFVALVAGDGEDYNWLKNYVYEHQLDKYVVLLGAVSSKRMRELMQASDVLFLPSKWEGIALTIYEAMACGLLVVGADVGGQKELVTDDVGFLLPTGDEDFEIKQYVDILSRIIRESIYKSELGNKARKRVCERFHIDLMGDRMELLFQKARHFGLSRKFPVIGTGVGLVCATQAIEYLRISKVADNLWLEREMERRRSLVSHVSFGMLLFNFLRLILGPFYQCGKKMGWHWLISFKDFVKQKIAPTYH